MLISQPAGHFSTAFTQVWQTGMHALPYHTCEHESPILAVIQYTIIRGAIPVRQQNAKNSSLWVTPPAVDDGCSIAKRRNLMEYRSAVNLAAMESHLWEQISGNKRSLFSCMEANDYK